MKSTYMIVSVSNLSALTLRFRINSDQLSWKRIFKTEHSDSLDYEEMQHLSEAYSASKKLPSFQSEMENTYSLLSVSNATNTIEEHIPPEWFQFPYPEVENTIAFVPKAPASLPSKSYFSFLCQDTFEMK